MSVHIILITHGDIGQSLVAAATQTFGGQLPLPIDTLSVAANADPDAVCKQLDVLIAKQNIAAGVLVLSDLFGATPCNLANKLQINNHIKVVSGVNLPMLIRLLNYADLPLDALTAKAISGGHDGIIECETRKQAC